MSRRTSFFNVSVFRTDIKRFWWIPVLHTLGIILFCLFPLHQELTFLLEERGIVGSSYVDAEFLYSVWGNASAVSYLALFVVPVMLSMLLFSYLNKKSAVATAHAQPVTRLSLYITHTAFGLAALVVPVLINAAILLFMRTDPEVAQLLSLSHIWTWVYTVLSYSAVAFTLTTFVGMFTGNTIAQPVFAYIFAALPYFAETMLMVLSEKFLYGYAGSAKMIVEKIYFGLEAIVQPSGALTYLGLALVFWVAGYLVYRLRHLENHGEIIAFPVLKPIFVYGVAVCTGFLGFAYISGLTNLDHILCMVPFGILGLIIANMISKKAFTLRGILRPGVAFLVTVFALFGIFRFDTTGYESRIPEADDVEYAVVSQNSYNGIGYYNMGNSKAIVEKRYIPKLTGQEDMENAIKFHQYKIETQMADSDFDTYMYVHYSLKNGESLTRRYPVNYQDDKDFLEPIMETKENKTERFPILNESEYEMISMTVEDDRLTGAFSAYLSETAEDKAVMERLAAALKADLAAVPYEEFAEGNATLTDIRVKRQTQLVYNDGKDTPVPDPENYVSETEEIYYIRASYVNTIAILKELGLYDALPKAEHYHAVGIVRHIPYVTGDERVSLTENEEEETITDPAVIAALYQYVTETQSETHFKENAVRTEFIFKSVSYPNFSVTRSASDKNIPENLKYLFE